MATSTERGPAATIGRARENRVIGGVIGFIAGGVCGGILAPSPIMENIAALFVLEGVAAAWAVHFLISVLLGLLFAGIVSIGTLPEYANRVQTGAGLGIVYGFVVWIGGVVIVMPMWLGVVTSTSLQIPNLDWLALAGLLVYGVILGALYPVLLTNN